MVYNLNGKNIHIPDTEITKSMITLGLTKEEAIQLWLEDNDYQTNEEVEALTEKAKENKISHGAKALKSKATPSKPRERKPDLEKEDLIQKLANFLISQGLTVDITNKSKIIEFTMGENHYKLDLIKQRPPKKT
jgi:hypothetical protein